MTSSVTSPFEIPPSLSYRLPIVTFLLAPLVFEIFDLKVADTHTNPQNSTLTDNKLVVSIVALYIWHRDQTPAAQSLHGDAVIARLITFE